MSELVCPAITKGARVYVRPIAEPDAGLSAVASVVPTHTADAVVLLDVCEDVIGERFDGKVEHPATFVRVLGQVLIATTLKELLEAAGMVLRFPIFGPHAVRLGVLNGAAIVVSDDHSTFALAGVHRFEDAEVRDFVHVTELDAAKPGPSLRVVKGGAS